MPGVADAGMIPASSSSALDYANKIPKDILPDQ